MAGDWFKSKNYRLKIISVWRGPAIPVNIRVGLRDSTAGAPHP